MDGVIIKALSGFYYVSSGGNTYECRARGKFRIDGTSPLVGDKVSFVPERSKGVIEKVYERKNFFIRPAVANLDALVFVAANTTPVTDPFLIDRVSVICKACSCELIVCINKTDIDPGDELFNTYSRSGFTVVRTSASDGTGLSELKAALHGKLCAFTGNSGVGKSSLLNMLCPGLSIPVAEISEKLGRGKHTTRHVELFPLDEVSFIADTPGFASFDIEMMQHIEKDDLKHLFGEFARYEGHCRFNDCAHLKEPGCAVTAAVANGDICIGRYRSYERLYELVSQDETRKYK